MKLKDAIPKYRDNMRVLEEKRSKLLKQRDEANKNYEKTGDGEWSKKAATLQLSLDKLGRDVENNKKTLDNLIEQWALAAEKERMDEISDPETGMGAVLGKIMTTVARMCAGDKVPYTDEKKVMEYDYELYICAKQTQMIMAAMKKKQKIYDSLWDEEQKEYNPEEAADNTEATGLPEGDLDISVTESVE